MQPDVSDKYAAKGSWPVPERHHGVAAAQDQGEGRQGCGAGKNVYSVIPAVGDQSGTADSLPVAKLGCRQQTLDAYGNRQRPDGKSGGRRVQVVVVSQRGRTDTRSGQNKNHPNKHPRKDFRPAMDIPAIDPLAILIH